MTNLFTIKTLQVLTDYDGVFEVNLNNDGGFNVMPSTYLIIPTGSFVKVADIGGSGTTFNPVFLNLISNGVSLTDIATCEETRLRGLKQFIAHDDNDNIVADAVVNIVVVEWQ
jgi:hypothetical protein